MRGYTTKDKITYWLFQDRIPVVKLVIVANILTFLMMAIFRVAQVQQFLAFSADRVFVMPWTLFTYPLLGVGGVLALLFGGYWLWMAGGSLERSWGSKTFGLYFFLMSAVTALSLFVGSMLTGRAVSLEGLWLPIAGVTVAFAMLNPEQVILFFFILPLKLKYLALIDAAIVLVQYGGMHPLLGLFALAGCGASYWYVCGPKPITFGAKRQRAEIIRITPPHAVRQPWSPTRWYQDYKAKKRLERMLRK